MDGALFPESQQDVSGSSYILPFILETGLRLSFWLSNLRALCWMLLETALMPSPTLYASIHKGADL